VGAGLATMRVREQAEAVETGARVFVSFPSNLAALEETR
jgi:hypothetical protein